MVKVRIRRRLFAAAVITQLLVLAPAGTTFAQSATESTGDQAPQQAPQEVTVTGSRIKRPNLTSASPISVLGSDEIKYQGANASAVENVLNRMPQFTADANENGSNGSDGTARLNLRNLGNSRVLVLVDGQRLLPVETADVSLIPSTLLERVDVVTGGASAVYGSDAVSGVVNFIMKKDLQGVKFDAQYGIAQHNNDSGYVRSVISDAGYALPQSSIWDGGRADFNVAVGKNTPDQQGNVTFYLGYRELKPVTQDSRDYSACALATAGDNNDAFSCGGSSNNPWGLFSLLSGPNQGSTFNNTKDGQKTWVPYDDSFLYNYAPANYIQRDDKRMTGGAFAHYDVNSSLNLYGSVMFMNDHSFSQIAPSAFFQGTTYSINCDNPLLSAQQANLLCGSDAGTDTSVDTYMGYRFGGAGLPRRDDLRHRDYRVNVGSKGSLVDGWTYDGSFLYSTIIYDESYKNDLDITKGARALQVVNVNGVPTCKSVVDGTDPNCVPADVFAAYGISAQAYDYLYTPTAVHGVQTERVWNATVNGDLGEYGLKAPWATNGVAVASGLEHRTESLTFEADAIAEQKGTYDNAGSFSVNDAYVEADIPIVNDLRFVKSLSFTTGYRYSDYSVEGGASFGASTYKFELQYAPVTDVKLRSSYNRAVRAPNVTELFSPQSVVNVAAEDLCAGASPGASLEACQRSGVTAGQYGSILPCPADQCSSLNGGNLALKPEVADTVTFGVVYTPEAVTGLSLSADYFDIMVDKYISTVDAQTIIKQCLLNAAAYFCNLFHRDPATGVLFGTNGYVSANR